MKKLSGKFALITGGSSGIGLATAKLFASEGAKVAITGRDQQKLLAAKAELPPDSCAIASDASDIMAIKSLVQSIKNVGNIDILILNAGYVQAGSLIDVTEEQFDRTININVKGVFFVIQETILQGALNPGATIVVTTSIANLNAQPGFSLYAASKASLASIVKSLALELLPQGIRLNAISPGPVATGILDNIGIPPDILESVRMDIESKSPIKRMATTDEIAKAVLFLASEDSSYLVGTELTIDGGMSIRP